MTLSTQRVQTDDSTLVARFQRGDAEAFNTLVKKHEDRAYKYAFRLTRNADDASDVVADAFVRVFRSLQKFKGNCAFSTWLYRIETNCFLDLTKKKTTRVTASSYSALRLAEDEPEPLLVDRGLSPHQHFENSESLEAVQEAVAQLPECQRHMIAMFHGESMTYEEISEVLGIPIGTVKSRLNRARLTLRQLLAVAWQLPMAS